MSAVGQTRALINRKLGYSEHTWCRAVASGSGISVLALHLANQPPEILDMDEILHVIRESHPLLSCKLHYSAASKTFTFRQSAGPFSSISFHDGPATLELLRSSNNPKLPPFHKIAEHEMNINKSWSDPISFPPDGVDVVFGAAYVLPESDLVVALRVHSAVCDRTTGVSLLRELMEAVGKVGAGGVKGKRQLGNAGEGEMSIERLIESQSGLKKMKKTMWAHGMDILGYSLNSLMTTNLEFKAKGSPASSEMVKLQIDQQHTAKILQGCESRGITLFAVLASATLLAAHPTDLGKKKYGVVTFTRRPNLGTMISDHHFGWYECAIQSNNTVKGMETLWELASTFYADFERKKNNNKHLTDMADFNFLMAKVIDNPHLTPSSSRRTSLVVVLEGIAHDYNEIEREIGAVDWIAVSSVHGVGPSIGIVDIIRNGKLDCPIAYPTPLHSREQMEKIVERMTKILIDGCNG